MLPDKYQWIVRQFEPEGDARLLYEIAAHLEDDGNLEGAATVYDRAFGLDPTDAEVVSGLGRTLDALALTEHGLHFRYVPGGSFLMGSLDGEGDERPWHPVWLAPFWITQTPLSWEAYCRLMGWQPPPLGVDPDQREAALDFLSPAGLYTHRSRRTRLEFCGEKDEFGATRYDTKPMVAVTWSDAAVLAGRLSAGGVRYALPTEAQWEKAARGGLIGARYAWGDEPPTPEHCDFGRPREFSIRPMKSFPPNAYGLYAMCGGVWEWTGDWYDGAYYGHSPLTDPQGPPQGVERVLRGGSWADCAEAVKVSFRASAPVAWQDQAGLLRAATPTVGFRLCRRATHAQRA